MENNFNDIITDNAAQNPIGNQEFYDPFQIARWQIEGDKVSLPPMQRNFVWKVRQIESLWDSILRGFPIGSFLMAIFRTANSILPSTRSRL